MVANAPWPISWACVPERTNHTMKTTITFLVSVCAMAVNLMAKETAKEPNPQRPLVEVAFVIDSTGSMSGLIEGAKEKIWSIANGIILRESNPRVRIGLVAYRDRGDDYVTRLHALTDDIDNVFANLKEIQAGGGGDTPESVNQALHEAVTSMQWSQDENTKRIIFLVGDCPPHMDYQNDVVYKKSCKRATKKGIVIHTVQCGDHAETKPIWKEIAELGDGSYIPLPQSGGMVAIHSPQDQEIARLSAELAKTSLAWGSQQQKLSVEQKNGAAAKSSAQTATERACYNLNTGGRCVQGMGDLLTDIAEGKVKVEDLKAEELPAELQKLTAEKRQEYIKQKQETRAQLNQQIGTLLRDRSTHIAAEKQKMAKAGKADAFDLKVAEVIDEKLR